MGSVLDGGEGGVRLQEVGDDLSTLHFQAIGAQTANERQMGESMAFDSNTTHKSEHRAGGHSLQAGECSCELGNCGECSWLVATELP